MNTQFIWRRVHLFCILVCFFFSIFCFNHCAHTISFAHLPVIHTHTQYNLLFDVCVSIYYKHTLFVCHTQKGIKQANMENGNERMKIYAFCFLILCLRMNIGWSSAELINERKKEKKENRIFN